VANLAAKEEPIKAYAVSCFSRGQRKDENYICDRRPTSAASRRARGIAPVDGNEASGTANGMANSEELIN